MSVLIVQAVKTAGLVAFYYCFSISLTFYNKWILTVSAPYSAGNEAFHLVSTVSLYRF